MCPGRIPNVVHQLLPSAKPLPAPRIEPIASDTTATRSVWIKRTKLELSWACWAASSFLEAGSLRPVQLCFALDQGSSQDAPGCPRQHVHFLDVGIEHQNLLSTNCMAKLR